MNNSPEMFRCTKERLYWPLYLKLHLYFPWSSAVMLVRRREQLYWSSVRNVLALPLYVPVKPEVVENTLASLGGSNCHLNSSSRLLFVQEHGKRTESSLSVTVTVTSSPGIKTVIRSQPGSHSVFKVFVINLHFPMHWFAKLTASQRGLSHQRRMLPIKHAALSEMQPMGVWLVPAVGWWPTVGLVCLGPKIFACCLKRVNWMDS